MENQQPTEQSKAYPLSSESSANFIFLESKINKETQKNEKIIGRIETITYLGFFIIILMLLAIIASYFEFVYSGIKNDDYKYSLSERVNNNENSLRMLKNCLDSSEWLNPKCFKN